MNILAFRENFALESIVEVYVLEIKKALLNGFGRFSATLCHQHP